MRLQNSAHTSYSWRIHHLAPDFRLEDVWALPTPGARWDFPRLVEQFASGDPSRSLPGAARILWSLPMKLGGLLGWDRPTDAVPTLRDRLPQDLRETASGPCFAALPFTSLYTLEDEWAAETANRTMHGVLHIGWGPDPAGGYRGQTAVLVKPNALLGAAYMATIRPFRHLIVNPALICQIGPAWRRRALAGSPQKVTA